MSLLLLAVIYAAFISLGLPDSLLGSAWSAIRSGLDVPLSYMGTAIALAGIICIAVPFKLSSLVGFISSGSAALRSIHALSTLFPLISVQNIRRASSVSRWQVLM